MYVYRITLSYNVYVIRIHNIRLYIYLYIYEYDIHSVINYAYRVFCNDRSNTDEGTDLMSAIIELSFNTI